MIKLDLQLYKNSIITPPLLARLLFTWLFLWGSPIFSQDLAKFEDLGKLPKITHYSRTDFQADAQFWTMTRDHQGILYFGNNDGAVIFDGERWQKVLLPNNSGVRSLATAPDGKVYAGGYNEIGNILKDPEGNYQYKSLLKDLKLENEKIENLWQVHLLKDYIIYRSFNELIAISGNNATHISSNQAFTFSGIVNNRLYVQDEGNGILEFDPEGMGLKMIFEAASFDNDIIVSFLPLQNKNEILAISKTGQFYKGNIKTKTITLWKSIFKEDYNAQIITAIKHGENFLLGTLNSKILLLTKEGDIIYQPNSFSNVFDSSILNFYQSDGNIWALLNNGLDYIEFDSPVAELFRDASVYDVLIDDEILYLATNKGVYTSDIKEVNIKNNGLSFQNIPGLEGQAWSIQKEGGSIIISHDKGLFQFKNGKPERIGLQGGFWNIMAVEGVPDTYLASNYNGLYVLSQENNTWQIKHKIKGFDESARDILQAPGDNTFWVCHGFKGVYKLKINEDYTRVYAQEHYTDQNGLSSPFNVNVFNWNQDIVFTSNTGLYTFNPASNRFERFETLNRILDTVYNTRKLLQHKEKTWVVLDDEVGFFTSEEKQPKLNKDLFLNLKGYLNRGMESILPLENNKVLVGANTGLYLYDTNKKAFDYKIKTQITQASYFKKQQEKKIPLNNQKQVSLPNQTDVFRVEFATPRMSPSATIEYQYILEGIDSKWSLWDETAYKEYTHLPPGDYLFKVRSRDFTGNTGEQSSFNFSIPQIWYLTDVAFFCYGLVIIFLVLVLLYSIRWKIHQERKKSRITEQKSKKLLELEIEQLKLKQDKNRIIGDKQVLEEDNIRISKELANYTMLLLKKREVFSDTYTNLKEFKTTLKTSPARKKLQDILMKLQQHRIGEEYMTIFDVNFERIHKNFFKQLKSIDPDLTKRELRLCAFVKMNLSNKEIAPLLNISVRGVETARYRVRKRLKVQETNFIVFLESLSDPIPTE